MRVGSATWTAFLTSIWASCRHLRPGLECHDADPRRIAKTADLELVVHSVGVCPVIYAGSEKVVATARESMVQIFF
jgi:hypothetical protein